MGGGFEPPNPPLASPLLPSTTTSDIARPDSGQTVRPRAPPTSHFGFLQATPDDKQTANDRQLMTSLFAFRSNHGSISSRHSRRRLFGLEDISATLNQRSTMRAR